MPNDDKQPEAELWKTVHASQWSGTARLTVPGGWLFRVERYDPTAPAPKRVVALDISFVPRPDSETAKLIVEDLRRHAEVLLTAEDGGEVLQGPALKTARLLRELADLYESKFRD